MLKMVGRAMEFYYVMFKDEKFADAEETKSLVLLCCHFVLRNCPASFTGLSTSSSPCFLPPFRNLKRVWDQRVQAGNSNAAWMHFLLLFSILSAEEDDILGAERSPLNNLPLDFFLNYSFLRPKI